MTTNGTNGKLCFNYCWDLDQDVVLKAADAIKDYDYCYTHSLTSTELFKDYLEFQLNVDTSNDENRLTSLKMIPKETLFNGGNSSTSLSDYAANFTDNENMNFDKVIRMIYANEYTGNHDAFEIFTQLLDNEYITGPMNAIDDVVDSNHSAYNDAEGFYQAMVNYFSSLTGNPNNQLTADEMNGTNVDLDLIEREVNEICFFIKLKGDAFGPAGTPSVHSMNEADTYKVIKINLVKPN
jgi:hypothetical protein